MEKKTYSAPQIILLGSIADLTKGSWVGKYASDKDYSETKLKTTNEAFSDGES